MHRTIIFALILSLVLSPLILTSATAQQYTHIGTLEGHTDGVTTVAFSSNGLQLASGSRDGTIRLWNGQTGTHIRTLGGHGISEVHSVTFRPGGPELASAGDHTVREWNTNTGHFYEYGEHQWAVAVAYHPHGHTLASGSGTPTIKLWNYHSGELIVTLEGHTDSVTTVAWSPDGRTLASGSYDQTIRLWNPSNGQQISVLRGHTQTVYSIAFSPDGRTLASGSYDQTIRLWNPSNGQTVHVLRVSHGNPTQVTSVAFHPNGRILASGHLHDSNLHLWNPNTGQHIARLTGHTWNVLSVAFSPNGMLASSGGNDTDNTIRLWQQSVQPPDPVVSIPDPNLAAAIRAEIGNTLTTRTMLNLTSLNARNRGVRNLTGLEHARNLQVLYLGVEVVDGQWVNSNAISDVSPLSGLTQLRELYLDTNNISDVSPLSGLTQLRELYL